MKQAIVLFMGVTMIIACNNSKKTETKETAADTAQKTEVIPAATPDSVAIKAVILDFYTWYTQNDKKLMSFDLYHSLKKNNAAPYELNKDEVKKYQDFVRDSIPQLGAEFDKNLAVMFTKADSAFKKDLKDDVPVYFDYDWYTNSQEDPQYLLDGIKKSNKWIITVNGDNATVEIGAPEDKNYTSGSLLIQLDMKKENGQWTIAKIGND